MAEPWKVINLFPQNIPVTLAPVLHLSRRCLEFAGARRRRGVIDLEEGVGTLPSDARGSGECSC